MLITALFFILMGFVCFLLSNNPNIISNPDAVAYIVISLTSIVFLIETIRQIKIIKICGFIICGYLFRIILMLWDINISQLPGSGLDSAMYHYRALQYIQNGDIGRGGNYSIFLSIWYRLFGNSDIIGRYINILLSMFLLFLLIKISDSLSLNLKQKSLITMLASFLPSYAIISVSTIREMIIAVLLTISFYLFLIWFQRKIILALVFSTIAVLVASSFHSGAIAPLLAYAVVFVLLDRKDNSFRISLKSFVSLIIVVVLFFTINVTYGEELFAKFTISDVDELISFQNVLDGGSGYIAGFNISNQTLNIIINTPIRMIYFLLSPMPWDWRGLNDVVAFTFSGIFYSYVLFLSLKAIKDKDFENRNIAVLLLIMCIASAVIFAWGVRNAGTALRHRDKFAAQYFLLFALVYKKRTLVKQRSTVIKDI